MQPYFVKRKIVACHAGLCMFVGWPRNEGLMKCTRPRGGRTWGHVGVIAGRRDRHGARGSEQILFSRLAGGYYLEDGQESGGTRRRLKRNRALQGSCLTPAGGRRLRPVRPGQAGCSSDCFGARSPILGHLYSIKCLLVHLCNATKCVLCGPVLT